MLAAALSHGAAAARAPPSAVTLTYLEINGWLLSACGVTVLIDPVLEGPLDFGVPALYSASKRVLTANVASLPPVDALLITQGLDDHAHERTLSLLAQRDPRLPVIAPPSASPLLSGRFEDVTYLTSTFQRLEMPYSPIELPTVRLPRSNRADEASIVPRGAATAARGEEVGTGAGLTVRATSGALVGPPWQRRENGYVLRGKRGGAAAAADEGSGVSVYLEPHVEFDEEELARLAPVDVVITPVSGQALPGFELVHGPDAALRLVERLSPRYVVPMQNGAVDAKGWVAPLVSPIGTGVDDFASRLRRLESGGRAAEVLDVRPGRPLTIG